MKDIIIHGDCFDWLSTVPDKSCQLIKLDLPYGTTQNSWDIILPFEKIWEHVNRIKTDNGIVILYTAGVFTTFATVSNIDNYKYDIIWQKTNPRGHLNANRQPLRSHENILVFYANSKSTYNPQKTSGHKPVNSYTKHKCDGTNYGATKIGISGGGSTDRYPTSVITFKNDTQKSKIHSTQKPVSLDEWLIKTYSNEGDLVLDFVAGSCTTAIACINTNRHFICIEKDFEIYEKGVERVKQHLNSN